MNWNKRDTYKVHKYIVCEVHAPSTHKAMQCKTFYYGKNIIQNVFFYFIHPVYILTNSFVINSFVCINILPNKKSKADLNIKKTFLVISEQICRDVDYNPLQSENEIKEGNTKEQSNISANTAQQTGELANKILFPNKRDRGSKIKTSIYVNISINEMV